VKILKSHCNFEVLWWVWS